MDIYYSLGKGVSKWLIKDAICEEGIFWDGDFKDPPVATFGELSSIPNSGWADDSAWIDEDGTNIIKNTQFSSSCTSSDNIPGCYTAGALVNPDWNSANSTSKLGTCKWTMYNNNSIPQLPCSNSNYKGYIIDPDTAGLGASADGEPSLTTACVFYPPTRVMAQMNCGVLMAYQGLDRPLKSAGLALTKYKFGDGQIWDDGRLYLPSQDQGNFVDKDHVLYAYSELDPDSSSGPGCYHCDGTYGCGSLGRCTQKSHYKWKWTAEQPADSLSCPEGYSLDPNADSKHGVYWCNVNWCDQETPDINGGVKNCKCRSNETETIDPATGYVTCTDKNPTCLTFYINALDPSQGTYTHCYDATII
jgi:hypothetical protein